MDIILDSSGIGVHVAQSSELSPGEQTTLERKHGELKSIQVRNEALSQTIILSFLQQKRHPAKHHFLVPCILATSKEVQFAFDDCKNDILLLSPEFPFFIEGNELLVNYQTIIASWLILNYNYLCSGPSGVILRAPKAEFPKYAGSYMDVYREQLKFRNVEVLKGRKLVLNPWQAVAAGLYDDSGFEWPRKPFTRRPIL